MANERLDEMISNKYNEYVAYIKERNIELEREYFLENSKRIPLGDIIEGGSFADCFYYLKNSAKNGDAQTLKNVYVWLTEYFLFSEGHDTMFKHKLAADCFTTVPVSLVFDGIKQTVSNQFNDLSISSLNPKCKENMRAIDEIIEAGFDMSSVLYLLYCNDFQFPEEWRKLCRDNSDEVLKMMQDLGITIGDFLCALIELKCQLMREVLAEITDAKLKDIYMKKVEDLRTSKVEEVKTFAHADLPVGYFFDHDVNNSINPVPKIIL